MREFAAVISALTFIGLLWFIGGALDVSIGGSTVPLSPDSWSSPQAASAFVTVQVALNWIVEHYPRLADWTASAHRPASLLVSLDRLEDAEMSDTSGRILRKRGEDGALRLRDVCVRLNDGNAVTCSSGAKSSGWRRKRVPASIRIHDL
jgi:hypothetical protein